ncbi:MAG: hypothetical protein JSV99_01010 [Planctomycetota bacterium]|nr:MAG: hypothetical protein JSV99_01010 [Planctomycetota bacterium]
MAVKTLQSLVVPDEKNVLFVRPEFSRWPSLLLQNKLITQNLTGLPGSRGELLSIAADYTHRLTGAAPHHNIAEKIIVTGHQAIWHHCGILAKNIITSKFAQGVGGHSLHLVLDHGTYDTAMVLPKRSANDAWHFERIELEQGPVPLEFRRAPQTDKIEQLIAAVTRPHQGWFCGDVWSKRAECKHRRLPPFRNITDFITCFQAALNSALGINMTYLPVSLLSEATSFLDFAASIIARAGDFARVYNRPFRNR